MKSAPAPSSTATPASAAAPTTTAAPTSTATPVAGLGAVRHGDPHLYRLAAELATIQDQIVAGLEAFEDGERFLRDDWLRPEAPEDPGPESPLGPAAGARLLGGGRTRVLEGGRTFERAGVNLSLVYGSFSPAFAATMPHGDGIHFAATGLSLVLHPRNPAVPTVHLNVRRLVRGGAGWYGGGADLTPYRLDEADARHFHAAMAAVCDRSPIGDYPGWKRDCDAYFRNGHRGEARGIGGVFYDGLVGHDDAGLVLCLDVARSLLPAYLPIVSRWRRRTFSEAERHWQLVRRGRYVEFNLLHDRGTVFGLRTGGRSESILMSLPPEVRWAYGPQTPPGPAEAALLDALVTPRAWLGRAPRPSTSA